MNICTTIEITFFEANERQGPALSRHSHRAGQYRAHGTSRYVPFMPIRVCGKKGWEKERWGERERGGRRQKLAQMTAREECQWSNQRTRASEQFSPSLAAGCWFNRSVLSLVQRFYPCPGFFPVLFFSATRFHRGRSVSGNTHAFPYQRIAPSSPGASTCGRVRGWIRYAFRCIEQLPHGGYPFPLNYFINGVFASRR